MLNLSATKIQRIFFIRYVFFVSGSMEHKSLDFRMFFLDENANDGQTKTMRKEKEKKEKRKTKNKFHMQNDIYK